VTTTALLLSLSAAMILAGVGLIWRDVRRGGRAAFLVRGDPTAAHPDAEVTVARRAPESAADRHGARASPPPDAGHAPEAAAQWEELQPVIARAVAQVNAVLAGAGVVIGGAGEPSWSMSRGYGVYRRLLISGESLAWLRVELDAEGRLQAGVKAHKEEHAGINATSAAGAGRIDVASASDLLSECLKPAASFAMRTANGVSTERWASETAWKEVDAVVVAALHAASGALAQADARFVPLGASAWAEEVRRHRLTVGVEVFATEVARMLIERVGDEIEVAVGVPDVRLVALGRRDRVRVRGLTTHALAEVIAGCSWPAIAHFREVQHPV
jgi:hypothetical protein